MTPGTRLLNAARASTRNPSPRENLTERELLAAVEALSDARALYPAAHAIGDRVLAEENDGSPAGLATVIAIRFTVEKVNYKIRFEDTLQKVWFDADFVHPVPSSPDVVTLPAKGDIKAGQAVVLNADGTVSAVAVPAQTSSPSWFPMDGRRVTEESPGEAPYVRMLHAGVHGHEVLDYQEAARHRGEWPSFAASADAVVAAKKEPK